jgi:DNA-binding MarR family transcriptional regulator
MHTSSQPCICARLRRASRALTRLYDQALEPTGLTVTQFGILRHADRLDRPTVSALAEVTGHERSALWRTLQPLAAKGWLSLDSGSDQRTRRVTVTDEGRAAVAASEPAWRRTQDHVGEGLGEARSRQLVGLLKELEALAV